MRIRLTRSRAFPCAAAALLLALARPLAAQRVLGVGEDATVLPRGAARVAAQVAWTTYNQLLTADGPVRLGDVFAFDSLGARQLELLAPIQTSLRELAQAPNAGVTLGSSRADLAARIARTSLVVDLGLTSRLMLTGRLPYVRTRSEVTLDVNPRAAAPTGNVGINPALSVAGARTQNAALVTAIAAAAQVLSGRLQGCTTNPTDPVCADRPRVETLVADARAFAGGIARTYGTGADTARGAAFVPLFGTALQAAIEQRTAALNTALKAYLPELPSFGTGPFAAQVPFTAAGFDELVTDSLGAAPIALVERSHIGDVELGAKLLLIDAFGGDERRRLAPDGVNLRLAVGGLVRFGTGQSERPEDFTDIATGDGQNDVEASAVLDLLAGRRFWASVVARYGLQLADRQSVRIPDVAGDVLLGAYRQHLVDRDLGDYIELQLAPRYVYNDYLAFTALWTYWRKGQDEYSGSVAATGPDGEGVSLDPGILGVDTDQRAQGVGGGFTYSTVRAFERRRARLPLEIQLTHMQDVSGSGRHPKRFTTQLQLRTYTRLFGSPRR